MLKLKNKTSFKIVLVIIAVVVFLSFIPKFAKAHSPNTMNVNYNTQIDTLTVTINHSVNDNTTHYVNLVEIWINDQINVTQSYTSQPSLNEFTYTYNINASISDEIKVKASCNQGGSITRIITAGETPTESVPASFVCMTILGLLVVGGFIRRKKN
ncbi:MAG: hypothetical protein FK730_08505 [Asgard group archaeon]|nr:hypothetical protein [Asgard group archaeon]